MIESTESVLWPGAVWVKPPEILDGTIEFVQGTQYSVWCTSSMRPWTFELVYDDDFSESDRLRLVRGARIRRWSGLAQFRHQRCRIVVYRVVLGEAANG